MEFFYTVEISTHIEEVFAVTSQFGAALSRNFKPLQLVLKQHCENSSASLLNVIDSLIRVPEIRETMSTMILSIGKDNIHNYSKSIQGV